MKTYLVLIAIVFQSFFAQNQTRRNKNLGLICTYNFGQNNQQNNSFQIGITKQIGKYLLPEIGIRIENKIPFNQVIAYTGALQIRKSLFKLRVRNRSGICKAEIVECFVTPEYFHLKNESRINLQNQFSMRYGLSLYHLKSGGSMNSKSWVTKIELYNRTIFTTNQYEMGIALRVQSFRKRGW
jgi:hypothetical protein